MKRVTLVLPILAAVLVLAGCGKSSGTSSSSTPPPAAPSPLDTGPRAIAEPVNEAKAAEGEKLFTTKICATCHGFGKKITCPDQMGVPQARSARWMQNQIMRPDWMTKNDPIARQLMAQYSIQMPNQGITELQAQALIEYIKKRNLAGK
jgi:cytochrome c5